MTCDSIRRDVGVSCEFDYIPDKNFPIRVMLAASELARRQLDAANSVISFERKATNPDDVVIAVYNFTPVHEISIASECDVQAYSENFLSATRRSTEAVVSVTAGK